MDKNVPATGHADEDADGVCDVCEEEIPCEHTDLNADAKCDACEAYFLPAVGTAFKLKMVQANRNEVLYFTGAMDGYYLATGNLDAAVDMYLEEVEGGYAIYFMNGETKNYLYAEISGTHKNIKFGETVGVWNMDEATGALVINLDGEDYYLGTFSQNKTFSLSGMFRITGENASAVDVSQFIGRAVVIPAQEPEQE